MAEQKETNLMKAIALVVSIVILSVIASLVVGSILDSNIFDEGNTTGTNTNETLSSMNNVTNSTFAIISTQPTATCNLANASNATSGEVINGSGNYTFFPSDCKMILQDDSPYIGEDVNVTYIFTYEGDGSSIINVSAISVLFGAFISGLLGFLGIIGIVLGVIWLVMYVSKLFGKGGLNDLGQTA